MSNKFTWFDTELEYLDHEYNTTRLNERAVSGLKQYGSESG